MDKPVYAFGLKLHLMSMADTLKKIEQELALDQNIIVQTSVNAAKVVLAQKDKYLRDSINTSSIVSLDGFSLVVVLRLMGYEVPERVPGIDLFRNLLEKASQKKYRVYFLGAKQDILEVMIENIRSEFPDLIISGYRNGYFSKEDELEIISKINETDTDLLFLGISSPKKENFLSKYRSELKLMVH